MSATNDEKNEKEEEIENEEDVFKRRAQWFKDLFSDQDGFISHKDRLHAIENVKNLSKIRFRDLDTGESPLKGFDITIVGKEEGYKPEIYKVDNPRANSSFGFVSETMEAKIESQSSKEFMLKIILDKDKLTNIEPSTIRIFRFEESTKEWVLVNRSSLSLNGEYAWAIIKEPGKYVSIGLPSDPWLLQTIMIINSSMPWLRAARQSQSLDKLINQICRLILCNDTFESIGRDPQLAAKYGLPPVEESKLKYMCERCQRLDLADGGLPETQLFDSDILSNIPLELLFDKSSSCQQWRLAGPKKGFSGRIKSLAIHPHPIHGSTLYAGAADGGVWKTDNGGLSWYSTMHLELSMAIGAIGIAKSSPRTVYAATGEDTPGWAPSYPGVGVYKTVDGGVDWDLLSPINSDRCTKVLVHPNDRNIVYVAGNRGLHKSIDGGSTWINVRTDHISDALMDPLSPNILYVGVWNTGIFKSLDGGSTWSLLTNGIPTGYSAEWIKLAMGLNGKHGTSFVVSKMGLDSGELYKSSDAGLTWIRIPGEHQKATYNEWTNMVAVDPNNEDIIFAGGIGLERSNDGGNSFSNAGGGTHADKHIIVFDPADSNICYLATDGGVYKSGNNGSSWTLQSDNLVATQFYTIGVGQSYPIFFGGSTQDEGILMKKPTTFQTWVDTNAGNEGGIFVIDPNTNSNIYVTPWSHNLRRSTDTGITWTTILNGIKDPKIDVSHLAVKHGDSNLLLCTQANQVFRSTNQGNDWTSVLTTIGDAKYVVFHPSHKSVCFVATDQGRIYRSITNGDPGSWTEPYTLNDKPPSGYITCIAPWWYTMSLLYISYGGYGRPHIFRSVDGGIHWTNASGILPTDALPDVPVTSIVFDQYNPEILYASTSIGVFRTRDGGDSWEPFEDGMPRIIVTGLGLMRNSNILVASTMGRGVYGRFL
ncbi:MAG TPA: hypothetical protein VJ767_05885 [Nitrososphaeraceae archaeon]|nr:hypothetical protein [Nitrososphaeraceae archaeon]